MYKLKFSKKPDKYCKNCVYGKLLEFSGEIFCKKKGFVNSLSACKKFKYDPLKRTPSFSVIKNNYSKDDFTL